MSIAPQSFYSVLASLVLFLYDHAITFDAEVNTLQVMNIWSGPRTWGKLLFLWTRYFGLSSLIIEVTGASVSSTLHIKLTDNIEYNCHLYNPTSTSFPIISNRPTGVALPPIDNLTGCSAPSVSGNLGASFVPSIANELVLCFLMLYKQRDRYRNEFLTCASQYLGCASDELAGVLPGSSGSRTSGHWMGICNTLHYGLSSASQRVEPLRFWRAHNLTSKSSERKLSVVRRAHAESIFQGCSAACGRRERLGR
ncbi:hypothetical protein JB92DRAFT_2931112 [Gautieria morchelliformis]|nr:hypothetical protein JB92DRAFT_2931112 [Gautieria morchelliformis]